VFVFVFAQQQRMGKQKPKYKFVDPKRVALEKITPKSAMGLFSVPLFFEGALTPEETKIHSRRIARQQERKRQEKERNEKMHGGAPFMPTGTGLGHFPIRVSHLRDAPVSIIDAHGLTGYSFLLSATFLRSQQHMTAHKYMTSHRSRRVTKSLIS